jgi:hypothetical protein
MTGKINNFCMEIQKKTNKTKHTYTQTKQNQNKKQTKNSNKQSAK